MIMTKEQGKNKSMWFEERNKEKIEETKKENEWKVTEKNMREKNYVAERMGWRNLDTWIFKK